MTVVARIRNGAFSEENDFGVRVCRLPVGAPRYLALLGLPILRSCRHAVRYLQQGRVVARFLDRCHLKHRFDVVEFSEGGDYWHRKQRGFKVVSHLHGSRYTFLKQSGRPVNVADWRQRRLELAFIRSADWVFSPSRALAEIVEEEAGIRLENLTILPYPLDSVSATSGGGNAAGSGDMRVIFAARNDPVKGGGILLDAAREVEEAGGGVAYEFYGYQPEQGQMLPDSVRIHGFVRRENLLESYSLGDVAVVPSLWDNSPNTVYEAMAFGLPVIGSSVGGISELIVDGETGYLVGPGDSHDIARRLRQLRDDPTLRMRMGAASRQRIMALSAPESNLEARLKVYRSIAFESRNTVHSLIT